MGIVALKTRASFLFCYIFKGQLYVALQKLEQFIEDVLTNATIWGILTEAQQKGRVLAFSALQPLVEDVFQS